MILEENYDNEKFQWCESGSETTCAADGLTDKLDEIANVWYKLNRNQIGIPSAEQIGKVNKVDSQLEFMPSLYASWTCGTASGDEQVEYWTSTAYDAGNVYTVHYDSSGYCAISMASATYPGWDGNFIRPVITLSI